MLILLVRHGETDWNRQGRRHGRFDIPLNAEGAEQMLRCGRLLRGLPVDVMYTSPLMRASESAAILAECWGLSPARIRREPGLIERDFGDSDGLTDAERRARRTYGTGTGAEPLYLVRERMLRTVLGVARHERCEIAVMVSHSAAIKALMVRLYGRPELQRKATRNAGVSIVEYKEGRLHPRAFNLSAEDAAAYLRRQGKMTRQEQKDKETI